MPKRHLLTGFTFILALLSVFCADAQKLLSKSRQSSYYTYIYKLEPEQVLNIYKNPNKKLDDNILHHPVDSFKTDGNLKKTLPYGNYINVKANKNALDYNLVERH